MLSMSQMYVFVHSTSKNLGERLKQKIRKAVLSQNEGDLGNKMLMCVV